MRKVVKILGSLVGLALLAELLAGYLNFQRGSERGLGLAWLADRVQSRMESPDTRGISLHDVYLPIHRDLRQALMKSYAAEFDGFMQTARDRSCAVVLLYIPTYPAFPVARDFFAGLADSASIPFVEVEPRKERYSPEQAYLTPGDTHPSRLLGQLTARTLTDAMEKIPAVECEADPKDGNFTGPWVPDLTEIRETAKGLAFRFNSDELGFRAAGPHAQDAKSLLVIGDSFSFGTSLADQDAWPSFLQRYLPQMRVMNAGVGGISIVRQHEILKTATRDARTDVLVLQVNETDLQGLTPAYWPEMQSPPTHSDEIARFF